MLHARHLPVATLAFVAWMGWPQGEPGEVRALVPVEQGSMAAFEERALANGLRVVVAARPGLGVAVCRLLVKTGLAHDPPGEAGFALYLARLLDKGSLQIGVRDLDKERESRRSVENFEVTYQTFFREAVDQFRRGEGPDPTDPTSRPAPLQKLRDVLSALEERHARDLVTGEQRMLYARAGASEVDLHVSSDAMVLSVTLPALRVETFFVLEADRLRNAVLRDHAATRDQIRREWLGRHESNARVQALDRFRALLWAGHPYGRPAPGADALDGVSYDTIERERARRLVASNMAVVVAGDVQPQQIFELAERYFGSLPPGTPIDDPPAQLPRRAEAVRVDSSGWTQPLVALAWTVPGFGHRGAPALRVAAELVSARTGATVTYTAGRLGGLWILTQETASNDELARVEATLVATLEALATADVAEEELHRARRRAAARALDGWTDVRSMADAIVDAEVAATPRDLAELPRRIALVTEKELRRVFAEILTLGTRSTWIQRRLRGALLPTPEVRKEEIPAESKPAAPVNTAGTDSGPASRGAAESQSRPAPPPAGAMAPNEDGGGGAIESAPASRPAVKEDGR